MYCTNCGTKNQETAKYCIDCGYKLPDKHCSACGTLLLKSQKFCVNCGKPVAEKENSRGYAKPPSNLAANPSFPATVAWKPSRSVLIAVLCIAAALVVIASLLLGRLPGDYTGQLRLGTSQFIAGDTIGPEGGEIFFGDSASGPDSFMIAVPEGAYPDYVDFSISAAPVISHTFGNDFEAASPLITIDNGHVFANVPLIVTVPIQKTDDEFAMGFYYDIDTGELEGIPCIEQSNDSIVLLTRHFSRIIISKIKKGRIVGTVETGFQPGVDDFQMPNYGSSVTMGNCNGQSVAAIFYYYNKGRIGWNNEPLYGQFDNNGLNQTPSLWEDDASAIRLCTAMQTTLTSNLLAGSEDISFYNSLYGNDDELTYYCFAYTMQITGKPQLMFISQSDENIKPGETKSEHAMIVYKIVNNVLYVADPNKPADGERTVGLDLRAGAEPKFKPYYSGDNASVMAAGEKEYVKFGYFGVFSLVDWGTVSDYWNRTMDGEDVGAGIFPQDVQIEVALDKDGEGSYTTAALTDGMVLTDAGTANLGLNSAGMFACRLRNPNPDERVTLYIGDVPAGELSSGWTTVMLAEGENDIGIYHERRRPSDGEYGYVNFKRYSVYYGEGYVTPPPAETDISVPTEIVIPPEPTDAVIPPDPTEEIIVDDTDPFVGTWQESYSDVYLQFVGHSGWEPGGEVLNDFLISIFNTNPTAQFSFNVEKTEGGEYVLPPVYEMYDGNSITIDNENGVVYIQRSNSTYGTRIQCQGTLSPDGRTIDGGCYLYYGSDGDGDGIEDAFFTGRWTAVLG